jgi:hypothetical protein
MTCAWPWGFSRQQCLRAGRRGERWCSWAGDLGFSRLERSPLALTVQAASFCSWSWASLS